MGVVVAAHLMEMGLVLVVVAIRVEVMGMVVKGFFRKVGFGFWRRRE